MKDALVVTGGCGFIGSNFIISWMEENGGAIVNIDNLTYAANPNNLNSIARERDYRLIVGDIADHSLIRRTLRSVKPSVIVNFAAETHVDRSIVDPSRFVQTNILGTHTLLQESLNYWNELTSKEKKNFLFLHISTDEVYGTLSPTAPPFTEESPYRPNNPYAASKAASDHLVRSYYHTYGLPTITTHCSNNYGPYQYPEKLIPLIVKKGMNGHPLPIYGEGKNERNWLHVKDHCRALSLLIDRGTKGSVYNIGSNRSISNNEVVETICQLLDQLYPYKSSAPHKKLFHYVKDRPGHDFRYDIDSSKIKNEIGWKPEIDFVDGLKSTIEWYIDNEKWLEMAGNSP